MKTFTISIGRGLDLDVLKLVETRVGICTNSGGGKSHLMRVIAERIGGRIPIHIIDWEGEWYTLRSKIDAVLVAKNGDLAPQVHTAGKLAQRLVEKRVSVILDVSSLKRLERLLFVASYIEALMDAPAKHRHPMLVFIDEAHRLCPEVASKGGGKTLLAAIQRTRSAVIALMDSGRKRAIGGVLATQRLSKVSKDAIGEANNVFIGRYAQDTDLKRVGELLGLERDQRDAPKTFKPGEFFAQGPALSKSGTAKFRSFDTTTKAPRFGAATKTAAPSKSVTKLLADLATIPEEVEHEAKDFKEAQAQLKKAQAEVKRLTRENQRARDGAMSKTEKERIIKEALVQIRPKLEAQAETIVNREREKWLGRFRPLDKGLTTVIVEIEQLAADFAEFKTTLEAATEPSDFTKAFVQGRTPGATTTGRTRSDRPNHSNPPRSPTTNGDLPFSWGSAPGKVLTVLVQYHPEALDYRRLAALAGVSPRSSTYRNAISKLRTTGLATNVSSGTMRATSEAHERYAQSLPALPSGEELIEQWQSRLGTGVVLLVFNTLTNHQGGPVAQHELARAAGVDQSSSTFRNALSKLRTLGLVEPGHPITAAPHVKEALT